MPEFVTHCRQPGSRATVLFYALLLIVVLTGERRLTRLTLTSCSPLPPSWANDSYRSTAGAALPLHSDISHSVELQPGFSAVYILGRLDEGKWSKQLEWWTGLLLITVSFVSVKGPFLRSQPSLVFALIFAILSVAHGCIPCALLVPDQTESAGNVKSGFQW